MELSKSMIHKKGLDTDPVAALCDADLARSDGDQQTQPDAYLPREEAKDEEKLGWGQQAGSENHASTDGDGVSEDAVTFGLGCHRSEGDEPDNDGDEEKTTPRIHNNNNTTSSTEASDPLHEHCNYLAASPRASKMSQYQSVTTTVTPQSNTNKTVPSTEASGLSQHGVHTLDLNQRTGTSPQRYSDPGFKVNASVQAHWNGSDSYVKTSDSTLDLPMDLDSGPPIRNHDSYSNSNTPNSSLRAEETEHVESESDDDAELLAKIARFELPNGPPPLQLNYEALKHLATYFLPGSHGPCIDITKVWGGSFHEIRILTFEDGWTCIGRFASLREPLFKTEAELATIAYVRKHTQIPVPEVYFVNHNENHVVGATFVLMERVPGVRLFDIWSDLSLEHRMSVVTQVASIVGELADLRFDRIGSLTLDGTVGPLVNISYTEDERLAGPFNNFIDFVCAIMDETRRHNSEEVLAIYPTIKDELRRYLASGHMDTMLQAPYRLIHVDLEDRNIMVTRESEQHPPKISGIIDWDHAFVGPSYYLYEHIGVTTELQKEEDELPDLKRLRQHFVKTLVQHHARNSPERDLIKQCFREKSVELTKLLWFAKFPLDNDSLSSMLKTYLDSFDHDNEYGDRHPYDVFYKAWVPDSDLESDE